MEPKKGGARDDAAAMLESKPHQPAPGHRSRQRARLKARFSEIYFLIYQEACCCVTMPRQPREAARARQLNANSASLLYSERH